MATAGVAVTSRHHVIAATAVCVSLPLRLLCVCLSPSVYCVCVSPPPFTFYLLIWHLIFRNAMKGAPLK